MPPRVKPSGTGDRSVVSYISFILKAGLVFGFFNEHFVWHFWELLSIILHLIGLMCKGEWSLRGSYRTYFLASFIFAGKMFESQPKSAEQLEIRYSLSSVSQHRSALWSVHTEKHLSQMLRSHPQRITWGSCSLFLQLPWALGPLLNP